MKFYNQLDENGGIVKEKVQLLQTTPNLPVGHSWVPWVESLESIKESLIEKVKLHRDTLTTQGGYKADNKWFHSDGLSRIQQIGLTIMGNSVPPGLQWKTMDKTFVSMTPTLVQQIFQAAAAKDMAHFQYAEGLIQQITVSSDPSSVDIYAGWPETYGG